jgi:hypothetical protein
VGKKKQKVQLTEDELNARIDRLVSIRPMANEYRLLCGEVKEALLARAANERATPAGNRALLNRTPTWTWLVGALKETLGRGLLEAFCPRKPDVKKLNQRLAACPDDKDFAACRVEGNPKIELEVLAAGEDRAVLPLQDEGEAA